MCNLTHPKSPIRLCQGRLHQPAPESNQTLNGEAAAISPHPHTLPVLFPQSFEMLLYISADFRCKDRRSCVPRSSVCDGRAHCNDGSDELGCPTVAAVAPQTNSLKCRLGSTPCGDGKQCVPHTHVCDGEPDCGDGSDEENCGG